MKTATQFSVSSRVHKRFFEFYNSKEKKITKDFTLEILANNFEIFTLIKSLPKATKMRKKKTFRQIWTQTFLFFKINSSIFIICHIDNSP